MPKESQPRKNAYDTYFPLLFAFKFKVKFDGVKKNKKGCLICFGGVGGNKKKKPACLICFCKKWPENLIPCCCFFSPIIIEFRYYFKYIHENNKNITNDIWTFSKIMYFGWTKRCLFSILFIYFLMHTCDKFQRGIREIWAASWQNQQNGMCAQRRLRSAWASAQSDQSLCCQHEESLDP